MLGILKDYWENKQEEEAFRRHGFPDHITRVFLGWQKMRRNPELRLIRNMLSNHGRVVVK